MALGSVTAGFVLNNSGTSLVHAMAYPVGGEYHTPHGITLTVLALACFDAIKAAKQDRLVQIAEAMGNRGGLAPREAVDRALWPFAIEERGLPSVWRGRHHGSIPIPSGGGGPGQHPVAVHASVGGRYLQDHAKAF
jgi:hypothetical protein